MGYAKTSIDDRFSCKVDMHDILGCWPWTGAISTAGYGNFWDGERYVSSHVCSYLLFVGPVQYSMFVLHRCDNKRCVRPDHLFAGTPQDNMDDMRAKGRATWGLVQRKLTPCEVLEIRAKRALGAKLSELSGRYGVCEASISLAARGLTYKSVLPKNPRDR